jgi:CelD/BcsL family acetyltransferase involved in cellulose biosynthesis
MMPPVSLPDGMRRPAKVRSAAGLPTAPFVEIATAEAAAPFLSAWERLADAPLERNVFAEPFLLVPALALLARGGAPRAGLVFDTGSKELLGVFPFERTHRWNHLPVRVASGWVHEQSYLGTPLLHADPTRAKRALHLFLEALAPVPLVEWNDVAGDGEFMHLLMEVLDERKLAWLITHSVTRPVLRPRASADVYLAAALGGDARRKLRSKEKGLAALGALSTAEVTSEHELEAWIADFLRLEASGWKGEKGTNLAREPETRRYFETTLRDAHRRGRAMALTLRAGDRTVAMKLNFRSGDEWFADKIAYDQELARFSPGLQLEIENIRRVHALDGVRRMDSCTGPTIRVFRDVWLDRRSIQSLVVATGPEAGELALAALPLLRWAKRKANRYAPPREGHATYKAPPRQVAALPLAAAAPLARRLLAAPFAVAATELCGVLSDPGDLATVLKQAVRLQCGIIDAPSFHDHLDDFFARFDLDAILATIDYQAIRPALLSTEEPFIVHHLPGDLVLGYALRAAGRLSIRLDLSLLPKGRQIPPHGHSRTVSGLCVVEGSVAVRRYDVVESLPDSLTIRPTFDGVLVRGQASTESDARDNLHWLVALEDAVFLRITVSHTRRRGPVPTSLNVWVDPRGQPRGEGTILARWIPEDAARRIPPFAR